MLAAALGALRREPRRLEDVDSREGLAMLAFEHEDAEIEVMLVSEAPALLKVVARWIVGSMSCLLSVVVFWRVIDGVDGACSFEGVGI